MIRHKVDALERRTAARRPKVPRPFVIVYHYDDGTPDYRSVIHEGEGEPEILHIHIVNTRKLTPAQKAGGVSPTGQVPKPIESMTDAEVEAEVREREAAAKAKP